MGRNIKFKNFCCEPYAVFYRRLGNEEALFLTGHFHNNSHTLLCFYLAFVICNQEKNSPPTVFNRTKSFISPPTVFNRTKSFI